MGVPKFYRWISERYPCLSQVIMEYQIPTFDNLYLDMNGIIHVCSHPNDADATFRISEEQIFSDIFHYIEFLFRTISPQKVFFMAVDGVAPRAKMNQQRGRRFRSAREAEELIRKAVAAGKELPKEERFDSNCITPGTEFMVRLDQQLKYFVNKKISTDPTWRNVRVVFSGHEVPGEGEHKVMDFIRYEKAKPDYDPNTRHCLYGLDADLIMLGMASHEPHFSLLREEVRFGGKSDAKKRTVTPESQTFHLLHLSLLREYIEHEFSPLKTSLPFDFDLECIIDDWILMGFLVGNDFIPHLPGMHIKHEILPYLYQKYIKVLPKLKGYINNSGDLHMERFESYLKALSEFDLEQFDEINMDLRWLKGKSSKNKKKREDSVDFSSSEQDEKDLERLKKDLGIPDLQKYFEDADEEENIPVEDEMFMTDFARHKEKYYKDKFAFGRVDAESLTTVAFSYVVGVQWILKYYFSGVPSWSWYYPFHYAPYVSDMKDFSHLTIDFDKGTPFLPFEQLMGVLPAASKTLLPSSLQDLMVKEDSPILDYYPVDFETDLNGKQQEWEAVVLIPFIDEERLLEAMNPLMPRLKEDEKKRNAHGPCCEYTYSSSEKEYVFPSPWPEKFPDVMLCKAFKKVLSSDPYPLNPLKRVKGLCKGVKLDIFFPGFPTLKHIPYRARLAHWKVKVFQANSRGENMTFTLYKEQTDSDIGDSPERLKETAKELVGKICHVGWPHLMEAKVVTIKTRNLKIYGDFDEFGNLRQLRECTLTDKDQASWRAQTQGIVWRYHDVQGIDLGEIDVLVEVKELQGEQFVPDRKGSKGSVVLVKRFAQEVSVYAYQTLVKDIAVHAPEYRKNIKTLADLYPPKMEVFLLEPSYYGCQAEVEKVDLQSKQPGVFVTVKVAPDPDIKQSIVRNKYLMTLYHPTGVLAGLLDVPAVVVSRITSSLRCQKGSKDDAKERSKVFIGLYIKNAGKKEELVGYSRFSDDLGWAYSDATINILVEYQKRFPSVFQFLKGHPKEDMYYENELFPAQANGDQSLDKLSAWLKQLPTYGTKLVPCGSKSLSDLQIKAVEENIDEFKKKNLPIKLQHGIKVDPRYIFRPLNNTGNIIPDENAEYYLLDRVVNVSASGAVPYGLKGTITGIHDSGKTVYEVVWDEPFLGGMQFRYSSNRGYRVPPHTLINMTHGKSKKGTREQATQSKPATTHVAYSASVTGKQQHPQKQQQPLQQGKKSHGGSVLSSSTPPSTAHTTGKREADRLKDFDDGSPIPSVNLSGLQSGKVKILTSKPSSNITKHAASSKASPKTTKSSAASEFANMVKEMESHSTKSPKPVQTRKSEGQSVKKSDVVKVKGQPKQRSNMADSFTTAAEKLDEIIAEESSRETKVPTTEATHVPSSAKPNELAESVAALFMSASTHSDVSFPTHAGTRPLTRPPNAPLLPTPPRGHHPHQHQHPTHTSAHYYFNTPTPWYPPYPQQVGPYAAPPPNWRPSPVHGNTRFTPPYPPQGMRSYPGSQPLKHTAKAFVPTSVLRKTAQVKQPVQPQEQGGDDPGKTAESEHFQSLMAKLSVTENARERKVDKQKQADCEGQDVVKKEALDSAEKQQKLDELNLPQQTHSQQQEQHWEEVQASQQQDTLLSKQLEEGHSHQTTEVCSPKETQQFNQVSQSLEEDSHNEVTEEEGLHTELQDHEQQQLEDKQGTKDENQLPSIIDVQQQPEDKQQPLAEQQQREDKQQQPLAEQQQREDKQQPLAEQQQHEDKQQQPLAQQQQPNKEEQYHKDIQQQQHQPPLDHQAKDDQPLVGEEGEDKRQAKGIHQQCEDAQDQQHEPLLQEGHEPKKEQVDKSKPSECTQSLQHEPLEVNCTSPETVLGTSLVFTRVDDGSSGSKLPEQIPSQQGDQPPTGESVELADIRPDSTVADECPENVHLQRTETPQDIDTCVTAQSTTDQSTDLTITLQPPKSSIEESPATGLPEEQDASIPITAQVASLPVETEKEGLSIEIKNSPIEPPSLPSQDKGESVDVSVSPTPEVTPHDKQLVESVAEELYNVDEEAVEPVPETSHNVSTSIGGVIIVPDGESDN